MKYNLQKHKYDLIINSKINSFNQKSSLFFLNLIYKSYTLKNKKENKKFVTCKKIALIKKTYESYIFVSFFVLIKIT